MSSDDTPITSLQLRLEIERLRREHDAYHEWAAELAVRLGWRSHGDALDDASFRRRVTLHLLTSAAAAPRGRPAPPEEER